ncbi:MAG: His Kinase (Phospho-acceptor) protein [Marmoricola sp.]|nr:His Kinase (Phospho-acceptor) protein [Marmoricola sp.]
MSKGPRRVTGAAMVVVLVAVLVAFATVLVARHIAGLTAQREAATSAAQSVTVIADAVRAKVAAARVDASTGQGTELASAAATVVSKATLTLARDSGQPVLDDAGAGVVVVAHYDTTTAPASVQDRRNHVNGYRIVPLDLTATLSRLQPDRGGLSVSGPNREIASSPTSRASSAASVTVTLGPDLTPGWSMTEWSTSPKTSTVAWLIALLLVLAGAAGAVWLTFRGAESRRRRDELLGLEKTSSTVAELATVAQHSLDLGDALPAVTTQLSSTLGLQGLSVAVPASPGERTIFVWGAPPAEDAPPPSREELSAGETLGLVLSRGSRVIAKMRVTAGRDLDRHEFRTLIAAGDVLASAVANAEAYSAQVELVRRMRGVDALKTVFLATASHELRTPVVAITGYAGLLSSHWDSLNQDQAREYAERIDSIAQRLNRLVEDILDFSRLESGTGIGLEATVLDLGDTVAQVLAEQPDLAADHNLRCRPTPGLLVNGTRQAIDRVVTNLVGNAAKYSDAGSTIQVFLRKTDTDVELVVEDDGPGIPVDEREQVFSPFYRGPGDQVLRTRGAGLGLAIVSEFAASMGGRVRVGDAPGGGASFIVSYPTVVPDPGAADVQA